MSQFHLANGACVAPMIEALKEAGAPVDQMLARSGLHRFRLDSPNIFVPAECMHDFFEIVARRETGPSLPYEIVSRYVLANMERFGAEALGCSDLRAKFLFTCQHEARLLSYETIALDVRGVRSVFAYSLAMPPGIARSWLQHLTVSLVMDGFKIAVGADWTPAELHLPDDVRDGMEEFVSDETVVRLNVPELAVVFPTEILALPMRRNDAATDAIGSAPKLGPTMANRIEATLDSSTSDLVPTLEMLADLSGISRRTLQRRLRDEGQTISEVVDLWRFSRALKLISNPDFKVREIAAHIRYSHVTHFTRAFKRWTGITPQSFRDNLPVQP